MAARVEVEQRKPQLFATLHFIYKGIARFFQSFSNRMSEVNQITVVGKNLRRCVVIFFTGGFEFIDGLLRELLFLLVLVILYIVLLKERLFHTLIV